MNILVLGHGLLGSEIVRQTGWDYLSREDGLNITDYHTYIDLLDVYDIVVNCVGYTNTYHPEREPAWSVNYTALMDLVDYCNIAGCKLIHISTDYIYANSKEDACESDIPIHFDNWYTYTKLLADAYVQARSKDYLLIRTSFKPRPFPWNEAWVGLTGNFDYVDTIAGVIVKLINGGASGVYNVGTRKKTMFDLAVETKNVAPIPKYDEPHNVSMNINKLNDFRLSHNDM